MSVGSSEPVAPEAWGGKRGGGRCYILSADWYRLTQIIQRAWERGELRMTGIYHRGTEGTERSGHDGGMTW
jgi:hypothetical protein